MMVTFSGTHLPFAPIRESPLFDATRGIGLGVCSGMGGCLLSVWVRVRLEGAETLLGGTL